MLKLRPTLWDRCRVLAYLSCPKVTFLALAFLGCASSAFGQGRPLLGKRVPPPIAGRPTHFSFIEGKYTLDVRAAPTNVHVEDPIRLEIRLRGAGPKEGEPDRKYIRNLFPESWSRDFHVQEMRDEHTVNREEKTWLFVYRLKPKHANVRAIDDVKLVYYDAAFGAKGYITIPSERIALTVQPKPDTPPDVPLDVPAAPESFYASSGKDVLAAPPTWTAPGFLEIGLFLGITPAFCVFGAIAYRRLWPDEPSVARHFRASAAQRAHACLRQGEAAWRVVQRYLSERLDFAAVDATPDEVAAFLRRLGFALTLCEEARGLLRMCDVLRYSVDSSPWDTTPIVSQLGPTTRLESYPTSRLAEDAARLIDALETDPCMRS